MKRLSGLCCRLCCSGEMSSRFELNDRRLFMSAYVFSCLHSVIFNVCHHFYHISFSSYLTLFLFLYLFTCSNCTLLSPFLPFYFLSPFIPFYSLLRALALSVAMMVYGKEEGADSLIEQLSKDRGEIDVII